MEFLMRFSLLGALLFVPLGACSTIISGTSQEIVVNTNPAGADCSLNRQNLSIAHVNPTPGSATIKKTKYDIEIACKKAGYQDATMFNKSGSDGATLGNIVAGGLIGWGIDSASGADNKYESPVNITLVPIQNPARISENYPAGDQSVSSYVKLGAPRN